MSSDEENRRRIQAAIQKCYSTCGETYHDDYYGAHAPYPPVHVDLLRLLVSESGAKVLIDAGRGSASFLRYLAHDGMELPGFDLTAEMVAEAKRVFRALGLEPDNIWQGSVLDRAAFSGPQTVGKFAKYDAAVCVGVLPHIAATDDEVVFANLRSAVRPGAR